MWGLLVHWLAACLSLGQASIPVDQQLQGRRKVVDLQLLLADHLIEGAKRILLECQLGFDFD